MGCGWLGMPLVKELVKKRKDIKGSTTTKEKLEEIKGCGAIPYLITLSEIERKTLQSFLDNDILIVNIPPGRNPNSSSLYIQHLENLNSFINQSRIQKVIFISSTSVYKETNSEVTENSGISEEESAQRLFKAEEIFRNNPN